MTDDISTNDAAVIPFLAPAPGTDLEPRYNHWLGVTDNVVAAAVLVLAEVNAAVADTGSGQAKVEPRIGSTEDGLLSAKQAADILNVHYRTIYELCGNGSLKHTRIGRKIRIRREDLARIAQPTVGAEHW